MYKKDTTYLNLERGIGFRYLFTGKSYLKIYYALHTTDLLSVERYKNNNTLPPFLDMNTDYYGIAAKISNLDYIYNPRKGFLVNTDVSAGLRKVKINNNLDEAMYEDIDLKTTNYTWNSQLEYYIPIWKHNTILLANKTGYLRGDKLFENELFRIGGLKSLRGFDEESIIASMYSIFTLEIRYLFEKNAFFSVFSDGAYYEKDTKDDFVHDKPFGIGAGINFETRAGIFSLNYAVGKQFNNPIDLKTAKVHFGFIGVF
jgi:hemolysin activation/secretion protein